jgi:photosystem II stability/assembly factor-like uncharacterized protein
MARQAPIVLLLINAVLLPAATGVFEANRGQAPREVRFVARDRDRAVWLLAGPEFVAGPASIRFDDLPSRPEGHDPLEGRANYFIGSRPERWVTNVPTFGSVEYANGERGAALRVHYDRHRLEFDLILQRGANPGALRMHFSPNVSASLSARGGLVIRDSAGTELLRLGKPNAYQDRDGSRRPVECAFRLLDPHGAAFRLGPYDREQRLIIDPTLVYSTYFGGTGPDQGNAVAADAQGNTYLAGTTSSPDFQATASHFSTPASATSTKVFVARFDPAGKLVYSAVVGGSSADRTAGLAVDAQGNAYVTGVTQSDNFPVTASAFQAKMNLSPQLDRSYYGYDAFVLKLSPDGRQLVYSTYLGGTRQEFAEAIAIDETGSAYVTGRTGSFDFPVTSGAFQTTLDPTYHGLGGNGAFVAKLAPDGSSLAWATYLCGIDYDAPHTIAVGFDHSPVVAGETLSADFPTSNAFDSTLRGSDGFVAKLTADGTGLVYGSFLGGSGTDAVRSVAVDSAGNAYLVGTTNSGDFPAQTPQRLIGSIFFRTYDKGVTWQSSASNPGTSGILTLAVDPSNSQIVYAGAAEGLFKSTDGGDTWSMTGLTGVGVGAIAIDGRNPGTLYAGSRSSQLGKPANTGNHGGLWKSTDGGATFTRLPVGAPGIYPPNYLAINSYIDFLLIDPQNSMNVYAVTDSGGGAGFSQPFYKSTDGGATWFQTGSDITITLNGFGIDPDTPTTLYGTSAGFYCCGLFGSVTPGMFWKSTDGGAAFSRTVNSSSQGGLMVGHGYLYSGTYRSTDGGATWQQINATGSIVAVDPSNGGVVYAIDNAGRLEVSSDAGSTWTQISSTPAQPYTALAIAAPTIYLGSTTSNDAFLTKVDAAGNLVYTQLFGGSGYDEATSVAIDGSGNVYVAGFSSSYDFPAVNALQPFRTDLLPGNPVNGTADGFVLRFAPDASAIQFSTAIGAVLGVARPSIAIGADGGIYVSATTNASDFPVAAALQDHLNGGQNAAVLKIMP